MSAEDIHPSAAVDPRASIGRGVRVGAFSVVGPGAVLDDGVEIGHHVIVEGRAEIGAGASIGHGAVIGGKPQDLKYREGTLSGVRIGAGTVIREYVTVHRAVHPEGWTEVGPRCLLMALSHVAHDCRLGEGVIVINYAAIAGHCAIGEFVTVGGHTGLPPFTRVGAYAYIGGFSKLEGDVPPFVLVNGVPATARSVNVIGLRRAGVPPGERRLLQDAFRILYRSGLAPRRAIERIRQELPATPVVLRLLQFLEGATRRGLVGPPGGWAGAASDAEAEPVS
jgi:UDP-N-acetylglucosamine acyltransferase